MAQRNQKVKVLRAFWHKGETVGKGSVIVLPYETAVELSGANKVEFVQLEEKVQKNDTPEKGVRADDPTTVAMQAQLNAQAAEIAELKQLIAANTAAQDGNGGGGGGKGATK